MFGFMFLKMCILLHWNWLLKHDDDKIFILFYFQVNLIVL